MQAINNILLVNPNENLGGNKRSLKYYEMYYQVKWNVLTATLKDSDEFAYYNSFIGGRFCRPLENYNG